MDAGEVEPLNRDTFSSKLAGAAAAASTASRYPNLKPIHDSRAFQQKVCAKGNSASQFSASN